MQNQVEYSDAIKSRYPEAVVFVVAKDIAGKANPVTVGWSCVVSGSPAMLAVALAPKRYTVEAIRQSKCFTVVFPAEDMGKEAMEFGTKSGRDTDKFAETGCAVEDAASIDSVILTDAAANFECELEKEVEVGDHILFIGKVAASHVNSEKTGRLYSVASGGKLGAVEVKDS
jgi:flavin reductase (DIM6/NTAB) family NADH-FMN oxidoreductase RutF